MSNITTYEVSRSVDVRDKFVVELEYPDRDIRVDLDKKHLIQDTYEAAAGFGALVLATHPSIKRFRIVKWSERVESKVAG